MTKLTVLKVSAVAAVIGAAALIRYRPIATAPENAGRAEARPSVYNMAVGTGEASKTLMSLHTPLDPGRPALIVAPPEPEITPLTSGTTGVKVGTSSFLVYGRAVYALNGGGDGKWSKIAEFPVPDGSLFKKYRPKTAMWTYETETGPSTGSARGIWTGYKFYSGEGFNGIGGAAFYDVAARETGVFRHPALLDCAIGALSVDDDRFIARTYRMGEGYSTVCNGVVMIDLKTLKAVSYMPKEGTVISDHDSEPGAKLLGEKYDVPFEQVLSGAAGFEKKGAPNWSDMEREKILSEGLVPYMVRTAREEARAGAAAEAARPKDVHSDHMWIDKTRERRAVRDGNVDD